MSIVRILFLTAGLWSGRAIAQNLEIVTPQKTAKFSLAELKAKLKTLTIKVDDPGYKKLKEFDVFRLEDVFQLAGAESKGRADEIVFVAVDGYSPNMPFALLKAHKAFLAYQEHGTPGQFGLIEQGKAKISPGPFYVVWEEGIKLGTEVPWPYQLVKIEVVDWKQKYPLVIPQNVGGDSPQMKGFAIFKSSCIRCHSINLQGGDLGPELNAPQNVTEYWQPDLLRAFIQNSSAFRYKSKMPAFPDMTAKQLDQLVNYLKQMKQHKIKKP